MADRRPNVLLVMCDQQRADTIAALGNQHIYTPNLDRLVARGAAFTNAYSTCPVCVPARYTIRTGCQEPTIALYQNGVPKGVEGQADTVEGRCGPYLARRMGQLGYRTFGVGKFHTAPWDEELGYEVHLHSEELYGTPDQRARDDFAAFIAREHPAFDFVEGLMGERTEMYYMPQMSAMPADLTVEAWAADRAIEQIRVEDSRPFFGFVSFIGPHPPFAPPIPFNRMYDPDRMPNPIRGDLEVDHMDEQIPWMNEIIWAEDINDPHARVLKARYYGEISYIDHCLGRILDAVEARDDAANTLIGFVADHGDHLGDHHAWQKESYFEAACHVPFLVSWPERIAAGTRHEDLVCLEDLFGIATAAAGTPDWREGMDVLGLLAGQTAPRERLIGLYGDPGSRQFKVMVREGDWKYIYMANGGREQLFNIREDARELNQCLSERTDVADRLQQRAVEALGRPNADRALDGGALRAFPFEARPRRRIYQFDRSRNIKGFPDHPGDVLQNM
ncbi:MAG TPA: sulfatase-like hydrolase/transferase [Candidatus Hydrogenedentes bacterium]|nr:sulfatase-like hydrolase/transferase [Candidatus Hydrogenedentota bacterium]HPG70108.1 sulfatase-like hydrolase/transferase [Candidatus Hydrogenedentota bacterium]